MGIQDNLLTANTGELLTIKSHIGMGTTAPESGHRVDPSHKNTSPAGGEAFSPSSSGNSAVLCPAERDMAGTAEEDFVPSAR